MYDRDGQLSPEPAQPDADDQHDLSQQFLFRELVPAEQLVIPDLLAD